MVKDVQINIVGTDSNGDKITSSSNGKYREENGKYYVNFEETLLEEKATVKNLIKFTKDQIMVRKDGPYKSHMVFDPKEETNVQYTTPYGILHFNIQTKSFLMNVLEDRIEIALNYTMSEQENILSTHSLEIKIYF